MEIKSKNKKYFGRCAYCHDPMYVVDQIFEKQNEETLEWFHYCEKCAKILSITNRKTR